MGSVFIHDWRPTWVSRFPRPGWWCFAGLLAATLACGADVTGVVGRNEGAAVVVTGEKPGGGVVQGSGCFVAASGVIITSLHQVERLEGIRVQSRDGTRQPAALLARDSDRDVALLKAERGPSRCPRVGDASGLASGATVIGIAAPDNLQFSTVTGIVSNPNRTYKGMRVIQSDLPAAAGSSGGPVFGEDGSLIGIIIGRLEAQQWVTVINPINNAYDLLEGNGVPVPRQQLSSLIPDEGEIVPAAGISPVARQAIEIYNTGVGEKSPAEKIAAYRRAVNLLPDLYEAWFNLGVASATAKDEARAIDAYEHAARLRPEAVEVLHNLGRVYLGLSRNEEAAACFARAVQLAPDMASAHNDLGEAYRRLGRASEARESFSAAVALDSAYAPARYNLGLACAAAGDRAGAARHLRAYLDAAPGVGDREQVRQWLRELEDGPE